MIEATIQFDFHLWSSNFHLPKTLTLQMKLSKYITLISRAFCTTKKKIIQKVKKKQKKNTISFANSSKYGHLQNSGITIK